MNDRPPNAQGLPPDLSDFRLEALLGEGATGVVYRAHQQSLDRPVALKILRPEFARDPTFVERLGREARAAAALEHPHLVRAYAVGEEDGRHYIAMDLVEGGTAADAMRAGVVDSDRAIEIGLAVARALAYGHERGLVHRDVKPSNVLLGDDGTIKLADLGLSKRILSADETLSRPGTTLGTPAYMAPEQIRDASAVGPASDVYAFAASLAHLLTGEPPFRGGTLLEMLAAKESGAPALAGVEPTLRETLRRALDPNAAARPTAASLADALAATDNGRPPALVARRRVLWSALALTPVVAAAAGYVFVATSRRDLGLDEDSTPDHPTRGSGAAPDRGATRAQPESAPAAEESADERITLGVMGFKLHGDQSDEWRSESVRDAINSELSGLSQVKVYSKEFIDFLVTRKGLSEIEAANQLGISIILSGSIHAEGDTIRIETHAVDVDSGVLEASYVTTGSTTSFMDLQRRLARDAVERIDLPVTPEEQIRLAQGRDTDEDDVFLRILAAEGSVQAPAPTPVPESGDDQSRILPDFFLPSSAHAQEPPSTADDEAAVRELLSRYRAAMEGADPEAIRALFVDLSPEQAAAQERYLASVSDLRLELSDIDVAVAGDDAIVSYTRTDDFTDRRTGRNMNASVRLTKRLVRRDGEWKLVGGR